jgi:protein-S-isoprenylcysteine O-methyltransferase Ste14
MGFLFAGAYLVLAHPSGRSMLAGLLLVLPGVALRASASGHVKKNAELTTTGPYAYTRNPLYLGSMLIAFGFAIASHNGWIAVALVALFAAIYWPTMLAEEGHLRSHFPGYDAYAQRVPRLLPRLLARAHGGGAPNAGQFSWALYRKHREYNALLGSAMLYAALALKMLWQR